jgi:hypothetical protein
MLMLHCTYRVSSGTGERARGGRSHAPTVKTQKPYLTLLGPVGNTRPVPWVLARRAAMGEYV